MFIQRDEPTELEHGGSKKPTGLAEALDNARILREFENDDLHAFRALKSAVRRHGADASPVTRRRSSRCTAPGTRPWRIARAARPMS